MRGKTEVIWTRTEKYDGYNGIMMLGMEQPGKRKRLRPKRRFMDVMREDMTVAEVLEEDADDGIKWMVYLLWRSLEVSRMVTESQTLGWTARIYHSKTIDVVFKLPDTKLTSILIL